MLSDSHIRENPWWGDPAAIDSDTHLRRLEDQPVVFEHDIPFALDRDAVYTLRGPRQVGKTTLLKRVVRRLLTDGISPRQVLYSDVASAGIVDFTQLQEYIDQFVSHIRSTDANSRLFILLDEVTGIEDWGVAVRTLHGRGSLEDVTVIATGSHALDVRRGGERAPGRRGEVEHWDWLMMPLCFRDFLALHRPQIVDNLPERTDLDPGGIYEAATEAHFQGRELRELFDRFLRTGGYPYAIAAEVEHGRIPDSVYRIYRDAVRGEVARANLGENYFRELVSWLGHKHLGREFSWSSASGDTTIGSKNTARKYLEAAEGLFVWHIYYRVLDPGKSRPALKSPKKLYPVDPFGWHVLSSWVRGESNPWRASLTRIADSAVKGELVESVCADHFRRRFAEFAYYFRDKKGRREIDFALFSTPDKANLVEVKYQKRIRRKHRKTLAEQGGGILATRDHLEWYEDDQVAAVPICYLLALLNWKISLFPEERGT